MSKEEKTQLGQESTKLSFDHLVEQEIELYGFPGGSKSRILLKKTGLKEPKIMLLPMRPMMLLHGSTRCIPRPSGPARAVMIQPIAKPLPTILKHFLRIIHGTLGM